MTSKVSTSFWRGFEKLPGAVQRAAKKQYRLFRRQPFHPSLQFKQLHPGLWSVRISLDYRALAYRDGPLLNWFWIGSHADYDQLIK